MKERWNHESSKLILWSHFRCNLVGFLGMVSSPLKEMLDHFISEGVLVRDNCCDFSSPLVFFNKKDGGIRMEVDYTEVDLQFIISFHIIPYYFNVWEVNNFLQKLRIYGLSPVGDGSKVTSIITP